MLTSVVGGVLIGVSASLAHATVRRSVGISGLVGSLLRWPATPLGFAGWFVAGLLLGGQLLSRLAPQAAAGPPGPLLLLVPAGVLVGFGTRLGSGCTSGHGVCGISRLSLRSLVATATFMASAAVVVFLTHHVLPRLGGQP